MNMFLGFHRCHTLQTLVFLMLPAFQWSIHCMFCCTIASGELTNNSTVYNVVSTNNSTVYNVVPLLDFVCVISFPVAHTLPTS